MNSHRSRKQVSSLTFGVLILVLVAAIDARPQNTYYSSGLYYPRYLPGYSTGPFSNYYSYNSINTDQAYSYWTNILRQPSRRTSNSVKKEDTADYDYYDYAMSFA